MFASYVIYSIKQTCLNSFPVITPLASYVIYSIKQTSFIVKKSPFCLLVMLFIVLSKPILSPDTTSRVC